MVEKILSHSRFENEAAKKMKKEMEESDAEAFFRRYRFVTFSTCPDDGWQRQAAYGDRLQKTTQ